MSEVSTREFWQSLYEKGRTGWDLGGPTPVFQRLIDAGRLKPGRMVVLGAGRGYDARIFAHHGFQVTAVDFAPAAIDELHSRNEEKAPLVIVKADIFNLDPALFGDFDYVLEYTFYCAIDPHRRAQYATVVDRLLKPGGKFVGLAFPVGEEDRLPGEPPGGPPYAVSADELVSLLEARGFSLQHRETPPDSVPGRLGREELLILQKQDLTSSAAAGDAPVT